MPKKYILITGDPVDGFFYYGPFDTNDDAVAYADDEQHGMDWWVAELQPPKKEE
jgi:hypothetical protein